VELEQPHGGERKWDGERRHAEVPWRSATITTAASATAIPAGFAARASRRWRRTVASTLVDIPQSGHGMPVSVRNGHASPG
jgi:hypothetical protein